jgi:hypothetical protein
MLDSGQNIISPDDQLIKIFQVLGHQNPESTSFISHENALNYLNSVQQSFKE